VLDALVSLAFSTIATVFNNTTLATSVLDALLGFAFSLLGTAVNDTAPTTAVFDTLFCIVFRKKIHKMTFGWYIWFFKHTKNFIQLSFLTPR
jgi:hypothetical protein